MKFFFLMLSSLFLAFATSAQKDVLVADAKDVKKRSFYVSLYGGAGLAGPGLAFGLKLN